MDPKDRPAAPLLRAMEERPPAAPAPDAPDAPCGVCGGTGFATLEKGGYSFAVPCSCRPARAASDAAGIPPRFHGKTFSEFGALTPSLGRARKVVVDWCEEFPAVHSGIFMFGPHGVGKTHLCCALLQQLKSARGVTGIYCDFKELLWKLKRSWNVREAFIESDVLIPIMEASIAVIDGIGDEVPEGKGEMNDWVRNTLNLLVNHRYSQGKLTVVTSRFLPRSAERPRSGARRGQPQAEPVWLDDLVGTYIVSRLREMCRFVEIEGDDFRASIDASLGH